MALDGKVFIITGAAGAVGSVVTQKVAVAGGRLALWDHAQQKLDTLQSNLPEGVECLTVPLDLTQPEQVDDAIEKTVAHFGQIDHLFHIAGGFAMPGPVHEGHLDTWHRLVALNATALYITCGKVAKHMLDGGTHGTISMIAARGGLKGGKNSAIYAASKSAALRIMESMAAELKDDGIRVNALSPSIVDTAANRDAMGSANADKWVTPEEIADTLLFLASDRASAITGANIEIYKRA